MQTSVTIFSYLKWVHLPTGTGQHLGGECWGIFGKASRLDVKNICVCMKVLCLTFCHCPAHKLPVHCDWDGWLVRDSLRQFKLRKQYEKWLFKIKVSCLVFFKFYTLQESSVEGEILNLYIILNQWLFSPHFAWISSSSICCQQLGTGLDGSQCLLSWNHRMVSVGGDLKMSPSSSPILLSCFCHHKNILW